MGGGTDFMSKSASTTLPTEKREKRFTTSTSIFPFCARICPYCAFYKERADHSQTQKFLRGDPARTGCSTLRNLRLSQRRFFLAAAHRPRLTNEQLSS